MLVKCTAKKPNDRQVQALGENYKQNGLKHDSHLTVGKTYLVLGLLMNHTYPHMGNGSWFKVLCDYGHIESYPSALFEVLDGRVDPEWIVYGRSDGILEIEPELMHQPFFSEHYLDGIPEAVKAFKKLLDRMEQHGSVAHK